MFENIIKDAYEIHDSSSDEDEILSKNECYDKVMRVYNSKNPNKVGRVI